MMNFGPNPLTSLTIPCLVIGLTLLGLTLNPVAFTQGNKKTPPLPEGVSVKKDIVFATHDGIDLKLDLYRPDKPGAEPLPVVLWVHGGGWLKGSKEKCKAVFLAQHGFAVASVGYRLTDVAQWPAQINDCYAAVSWIRENASAYGLDPNSVGAWGGSAVGHLVALLGTRTPPESFPNARVQAVCDWYGPTNLLTMPPNNVSEKRTAEQVANSNGAKLLGATVRDVPEIAKDASALFQISKDDASFLIMHGSEDPGVPVSQSTTFHEALEKAGVDSKLVIVEGAGHGGKEFQTDEVRNEIIDFFTTQLKERFVQRVLRIRVAIVSHWNGALSEGSSRRSFGPRIVSLLATSYRFSLRSLL